MGDAGLFNLVYNYGMVGSLNASAAPRRNLPRLEEMMGLMARCIVFELLRYT